MLRAGVVHVCSYVMVLFTAQRLIFFSGLLQGAFTSPCYRRILSYLSSYLIRQHTEYGWICQEKKRLAGTRIGENLSLLLWAGKKQQPSSFLCHERTKKQPRCGCWRGCCGHMKQMLFLLPAQLISSPLSVQRYNRSWQCLARLPGKVSAL